MAPLLLPCAPTTAPCSEPDRLRNALISPARRQPPKTSHACLKPQQRGGVPRGRDGGQALARLLACRVGARQGILHPAQPSPSVGASLAAGRAMDNGGTKRGSSAEPRGGRTVFLLLYICTMPSTK